MIISLLGLPQCLSLSIIYLCHLNVRQTGSGWFSLALSHQKRRETLRLCRWRETEYRRSQPLGSSFFPLFSQALSLKSRPRFNPHGYLPTSSWVSQGSAAKRNKWRGLQHSFGPIRLYNPEEIYCHGPRHSGFEIFSLDSGLIVNGSVHAS